MGKAVSKAGGKAKSQMQEAEAVSQMLRSVQEAAEPFEGRWTMTALKAVDSELHEAMRDQLDMLNEAAVIADLADVERHTAATIRGYRACVEAMERAGAEDDAYVLGYDPDTGLKVAIGYNKAAIKRVQERQGSEVIWMNPNEVARMVAGLQNVAKVKALFPGAEVEEITRYQDEGAKDEE